MGNPTSRSFGLVDQKLAEAEFFLRQMEQAGPNLVEFRFYFSAFVSAARSVTFALQAVLKSVEGFTEWYEPRQQRLAADPLSAYFLNRRNETLKTGETRINAGHFSRGKAVYFFVDAASEKKIIKEDVASACRNYLRCVRDLIVEARRDFPKQADPDWYFRIENLASEGLSIEDLEEMLGFPRGWTSGIPTDKRLEALSRV